MRERSLTLLVLAMLSLGFVQERAPTGRGAAGQTTLTRSASRYQDLEIRLIQALQDRSDSTLNQLLANDFEEWSAERSGATSKRAWRQAAFAMRVQPSVVRDLTVREFGDTAVVSFLLEAEPTGRDAPATAFVVDIWTRSTNTLQVRYRSIPVKPAPDRRRHE
jgi:hypothetical protein